MNLEMMELPALTHNKQYWISLIDMSTNFDIHVTLHSDSHTINIEQQTGGFREILSWSLDLN